MLHCVFLKVLKAYFVLAPGCCISCFSAFKAPRDHMFLMWTYCLMTDMSDAFSWWQISRLCGLMCFEWVELFDLHLCYWFKPCEHCSHGSLPLECTFSRSLKRTSLNINKAQRVLMRTCFESKFAPLLSTDCETVKVSFANQFCTVARACWCWPVVDTVGGYEKRSVLAGVSASVISISLAFSPVWKGRVIIKTLHLWQATLTAPAKKMYWTMWGWWSWGGLKPFSWMGHLDEHVPFPCVNV